MRLHHVIAVAAVLVVGLGAKQFFFPPIKAEADIPVASMNSFQMHLDHGKHLPQQKMDDMSFIFSEAN